MKFDGPTYKEEHDRKRLTTQYERVKALMMDGEWRTLREISSVTGAPEASVSALLRDFRKERNGGHTVLRQRRGLPGHGLFEYKLILRKEI